MLALSIRAPWSWFIVHSSKRIENRDWSSRVRGRVLVHASMGMTRVEYSGGCRYATEHCGVSLQDIPSMENLRRGGFIGTVEIVDCVTSSNSPWFVGAYGFVLNDPQPMDFVPYKGRLGFFEVSDAQLHAAVLAGGAPLPLARIGL